MTLESFFFLSSRVPKQSSSLFHTRLGLLRQVYFIFIFSRLLPVCACRKQGQGRTDRTVGPTALKQTPVLRYRRAPPPPKVAFSSPPGHTFVESRSILRLSRSIHNHHKPPPGISGSPSHNLVHSSTNPLLFSFPSSFNPLLQAQIPITNPRSHTGDQLMQPVY